MAKGMWQVLLLGLVAVAAVVADMMHDARNWEVADSAAELVEGFDAVEEVSDSAVARGEV